MLNSYAHTSGTGVANADGNSAVLAAPTVGKIMLQKAIVCINVAGSGGDNVVSLQNDAGVVYFKVSANAVGVYPVDFGDKGYPITALHALNIVSAGSATKATVRCTAVGYITE